MTTGRSLDLDNNYLKLVIVLSLMLSSFLAITVNSAVDATVENSPNFINLYSSTQSINSGSKTVDILGSQAISFDLTNFKYKQDQYILSEITLYTNHSSIWWETEYRVTVQYHQFGYNHSVLEEEELTTFKNDTTITFHQKFTNLGISERDLYISLHVVSGITSPSTLIVDYRVRVIQPPSDVELDETMPYIANVSSYNNIHEIQASTWAYDRTDPTLFILPNTIEAKNITKLVNPGNQQYNYNINVIFSVLGANDERTGIELKIYDGQLNVETSEFLRVEGGGIFTATIEDFSHNSEYGLQELVIEHSGESIQLTILEVQLHIPSLILVPVDQGVPFWIELTSGVLAISTALVSTIIVYHFGKLRIEHAKKDSAW